MKDDYSDVVFSQGLVCMNKNNNSYCVVIDGHKGNENDRSSLVIEFSGKDGFILNCPPNRALKPTGRICGLERLAALMCTYVSFKEE